MIAPLVFALVAVVIALVNAQSWTTLPGSLYASSEPWGTCQAASWPPSNIGQPLVPQTPDSELREMLAEVDPARIRNIVTTLANFGTRHTLSSQTNSTRGIGAARDWIFRQMNELARPANGTASVYLNSYIQGVAERISFPVNISNVVAEIKGSVDPNRVYVVTGHYDSRRIDIMDYTGDAPGADDDATGVAVVLEMLRICATRQPAATMIFAATSGEEQSLLGSAHLAQTLKNSSRNVEGNWNNDIVGTGSSAPTAPVNNHTVRLFGASLLYPASTIATSSYLSNIGLIGGENDSPARNLGRFIAEVAAGASQETDMQVALIYRPDRYLRGGDHESFLAQGFPAVRFTEAVEDFAHQHQDPRVQDGIQYGDLLQYVDFDYVARVARVNLASMWSAANAPALPTNVSISEVVGFPAAAESTPPEVVSNDSQIRWSVLSADPLVASYELVWRASGALQWTNSLNVGRNGTVTVNLGKDDYQFGLRAVGKDGRKSPAVFPLPM